MNLYNAIDKQKNNHNANLSSASAIECWTHIVRVVLEAGTAGRADTGAVHHLVVAELEGVAPLDIARANGIGVPYYHDTRTAGRRGVEVWTDLESLERWRRVFEEV